LPEDAIIRRNTAAIATLSMFNSGEVRRNGFENSQTNIIQQRLKRAAAARTQEASGGKVQYEGVDSITDEQIAQTPTDLYREGFVYYYRTHAHPNSTFLYTTSSLMDLMTWDCTAGARTLYYRLLPLNITVVKFPWPA
jgi:hypothetical protein